MKKIISTLLFSICVCYADQNLNSNGDIPLVEDSVKVDTIIAGSPKEAEATVKSLFDSVPKTNSKPQKIALAPEKKNPISIKAAESLEAQNIIALLKEAQSALDNHADVTALGLFGKACGLAQNSTNPYYRPDQDHGDHYNMHESTELNSALSQVGDEMENDASSAVSNNAGKIAAVTGGKQQWMCYGRKYL
jgi:hypothetical protein